MLKETLHWEEKKKSAFPVTFTKLIEGIMYINIKRS